MIEKYLRAIYRDGARCEIEGGKMYSDCWGLVRAARVEIYGRQLLPSFGGKYQHDPEGFTAHYKSQAENMEEIQRPAPGCVVAVIRRKLGICQHVGLVIHDVNGTGHGLHVLEINPHQNARIVPLYRFCEAYPLRVIKFYDDPGISQQA